MSHIRQEKGGRLKQSTNSNICICGTTFRESVQPGDRGSREYPLIKRNHHDTKKFVGQHFITFENIKGTTNHILC